MNGLKIMSWDVLSSVEDILPKVTSVIRNNALAMVSILGASVLLLLFGSLCYYFVARMSKGTSQNNGSACKLSSDSSSTCRIFTFQEVQEATNNFQEDLLIGTGGFGKVYKGKLENGTRVAVKRASPESRQGVDEFQNEIDLLSKLHHRHIVSLLGYCHEGMEMILVYEYIMANGTLSKCLYVPNVAPLSWKQRLEICIGAARGLHHLHTSTDQGIIHRDVKTDNILLDDNFVAKVTDLGISKKGSSLYKSHVTTFVKGTYGYIDPEYFRNGHLTEKSDVYSFGVVLIEAICGRPALDHGLTSDRINVAVWALNSEANGQLNQIIDPNLIGNFRLSSLKKVWEVAKRCLAEHATNRPPMSYVLYSLEDALHLELRNIDDEENSFSNCTMQGSARSETEVDAISPLTIFESL
ncbi:receptor-like protein kinase THESEUS 1 [Gastrolobium bilobum]|uniref:receptor-like protein kinase THESEUS 1 n=1 Tax=Gastrolobium bilobum TaxID=150636 RepID=UPI002AB0A955|nr:receptor-like protein kinase THESEUS 1 [Gastrolobium bilobum]